MKITRTLRLRSNSFRFAILVLAALASAGCELENATAITVDTSDPNLLIRGARNKFNDGMGITASVFVASDEGASFPGQFGPRFVHEDTTGDMSTFGATTVRFTEMHTARRLAEFAALRGAELGLSELEYLGRVWHGWILLRLAEMWGDQPFNGSAPVPTSETFAKALAEFDIAKAATADSTRHRAFAGIARVNYVLGKPTANRDRLQAAIAAAQTVLDQRPTFVWAELPNFNDASFWMGRGYKPTAFYKDIPIWFPQSPASDPTLTFGATTKPQGTLLIDADELRLIQADAHLIMGDLAAAKAAVKTVRLLPINNVRVGGRDPKGPPLTTAQINAFIDPLTAAQLRTVIEDLQRENQYLSARRNVGPNGVNVFPIKLPLGA